ncbi:exosortase F system-associated membrane protein [Wenyingzhuangia aestuarii]|uniref:exosortase F system-associated membrane protein n=1 Tax=Wenyingzhuangia aestuarii TaxID=1647582 RepID=UPI00143A2972|nr:exosortase F system-associated protein [Wenyingzhuangia aestuarii]NJB82961.1 exosortase F-associated protein [Wenyingzhuangia aestuarii]
MPKVVRVLVVVCLLLCLVLVRAFEYDLFYDPFLNYFESDHLTKPMPEVAYLKLFFSYLFRFSLNSGISFLILKVAFPVRSFLKTIMSFYGIAFLFLSVLFFGLIISKVEVGYLFPFYVRRFIIHPVFIIVLFPFVYLLKKRYRFNLE